MGRGQTIEAIEPVAVGGQDDGGADLILGNGVVVDCGYCTGDRGRGGVAISGEIIADVGRTEELRRKYPEAGFEDVGGRLIMPGMMCAHTHLCQSVCSGNAA